MFLFLSRSVFENQRARWIMNDLREAEHSGNG